MIRFLAARATGAAVTLLVKSFVIFALIGLMPGDPLDMLSQANPDATPEQIATLRHIYGVDQPIGSRYWAWLQSALHGDFGFSRLQHRPVLEIVLAGLGNTLVLTGLAFVISTGIAVMLGTIAATRRGSWIDRAINFVAYAGISVPSFWLALVLIYVFAVRLGWLPAGGMPHPGDPARDWGSHLLLPVVALVMVEIGGLTRYARSAMLEVLDQDYIRTARAKGLTTRRVVWLHALRNAMIPVITIIALGFGHLFSGALLVENIFAWRGMGRLILEAIMGNDYNLALVCLLFTTAMILMANILADLAYSWLDPRISLGGAAAMSGRLRRLSRDRAALFGLVALVVLVLVCFAAPLFERLLGVSASDTDLMSRFDPPGGGHLLGSDDAGRDEFTRLLAGGWTSLSIGLLGAVGSSFLGTVIGAVAGYVRGKTDMVLMRFTDGIIALPTLPLLIILAALDLSKLGFSQDFIRSGAAGYWRIVAIVTLLGWTGVARLVRASTLALTERDFVEAARAQGASSLWILRKHILPNAISPVIVATTLAMGRVILAESALSFLGVGIQPPQSSWGSMLTNAQELIGTAPELAVYPGVLILVSVVAINFLGDGLQAAFDPRERG